MKKIKAWVPSRSYRYLITDITKNNVILDIIDVGERVSKRIIQRQHCSRIAVRVYASKRS